MNLQNAQESMPDKLPTMNCMGHGHHLKRSSNLLTVWVSKCMIFLTSQIRENVLLCLSKKDLRIAVSDLIAA